MLYYPRMIWDLPTTDDTLIWNTWLSAYHMPSLAVADRLGLFELLHAKPASAEELAARTGIGAEPLKAPRQPRTVPTARITVSASTNSIATSSVRNLIADILYSSIT